jgi:hypothetical protein
MNTSFGPSIGTKLATNYAKILILSPIDCRLVTSGNRARISGLMTALGKLGHQVRFHCFGPPGAYATIPIPSPHWLSDELQSQVEDIVSDFEPDIVFLEYPFYSEIFELTVFRYRVCIIDVHDMFHRRNEEFTRLGIHYDGVMPSYSDPSQELTDLSRADAVIGIQTNESTYFRSIGLSHVHTIGHLVEPNVSADVTPIRPNLLFIGSKSLVGKVNLELILSSILPRIKLKVPTVQLSVVGAINYLMGSLPESCLRLDYADDLCPHFQAAQFSVNFDQFATGLSIKSLTSLAHGCPVVTTETGARGLPLSETNGYVITSSIDEFVDACVSLLSDPARRQQLAHQAIAFSQSYYQENLLSLSRLVRAAIAL